MNMASQKQIVITIERDGSTKIDAQNFAGVGCEKATKALEVALVGDASSSIDRKPKPERFHQVGQTNSNMIKR